MAYRLVGYFENWAQYRQAGGKFLPNQIDPFLFTHINFAFGIFGFVTRSVDPKNPRLTGDYTVQPVEWDDQTQLYPELQFRPQLIPNASGTEQLMPLLTPAELVARGCAQDRDVRYSARQLAVLVCLRSAELQLPEPALTGAQG
jgi:GH18 family chitinase